MIFVKKYGIIIRMIIKEIRSKTILSVSKIYDYVINPYTGCAHACSYCYARFMKKFTGHTEPWGEFVDVKINAAELLQSEITRKKPGTVWMSGVCDPYQPLEKKYELTRRCLGILVQGGWPVVIQTRSPLVLRDIDIIRQARGIEAGLSITTADDSIRRIFEPLAPPVSERIKALDELHQAGIRTYAMIAPLLPGAGSLPGLLAGKVDYVLVDRMNYNYADRLYARHGLTDKLDECWFRETAGLLTDGFSRLGIECRVVF